MERQPFGDPFQRVIERNGLMSPQVMLEEGVQCCTPKWYFSKKEIEEQSPSRKDGISFKKETVLRSLYCSFLQDLGMKLKVPQVTIATAMMFCHRFYLRQSHATNEWQTIGTVSMFLACKVEETPRLLKDVVFVAYETMHKRDPSAAQRIKQKDIFEKQKELLVTGERVLLATIGFDFNIQHPYKPLVAALKKLDISHNDLAKVAWNFVNDWLRTTLCLQYKPHYVAAGSLYLAAKFHKVKLPSEKEKVWWLEFDVTPQRLEEVIQQMLTLLEQSKNPLMLLSRERVTQATVSKRAPSDSPQSCVVNGLNKTGDSGKRVEKLGGDGRLHKLRQNTSSDDVRAAKKEEISECDKKKPYLHNRQNIPNEDIRVPKKEEVSGPLTSFSHEKVTQAALVKKTQFGSPKSGLLNGLHPCSNSRNRGDEKAAEINAPIVDICVARKESQSQTSDSGSAHSVVEDGDRFDEGEVQVKVVAESKEIASNVIASDDAELNKSEAVNRCNKGEVHTKEAVESNENAIRDVSSDAGLNKIDKDRIREALKKRKYDRIANKKTVKSTHEDGDDDSWIVRELEDGIELQSSSAEKKQRL